MVKLLSPAVWHWATSHAHHIIKASGMQSRVRRMPMHRLGLCSTVNAWILCPVLCDRPLVNKYIQLKIHMLFSLTLLSMLWMLKTPPFPSLQMQVSHAVVSILARVSSTKFLSSWNSPHGMLSSRSSSWIRSSFPHCTFVSYLQPPSKSAWHGLSLKGSNTQTLKQKTALSRANFVQEFD